MNVEIAPGLPAGWLYKWANYLKGYKKRWFVLENGLFSYYSNANTVSHTCIGTIDLRNVRISSKNSQLSFLLRENHGRTHHLKALSEQDKVHWLSVLNSAKSKLSQQVNGLESDSCSDELNTFAATRRSLDDNKPVQNNISSSWRSFRRFRRRPRQPTSVSFRGDGSVNMRLTTSVAPTIVPMAAPLTFSVTSSQLSLPIAGESQDSNRSKNANSPPKQPTVIVDPVMFSPRRRRFTLNYGSLGEVQVAREFQNHLSSVTSNFERMIIEKNRVLESIQDVGIHSGGDGPSGAITIHCDTFARFQSAMDEFFVTCQKTMANWVTAIEWLHRRLAEECDKGSRLERTVEQLAKQHRSLEMQLYSNYASLNSIHLKSPPASAGHTNNASDALYRDASRRMQSFSSVDDVYFDAECHILPSTERSESLAGASTMRHSSFGSFGSLANVDESSGSEEEMGEEKDNFSPAMEEGMFDMARGCPSLAAATSNALSSHASPEIKGDQGIIGCENGSATKNERYREGAMRTAASVDRTPRNTHHTPQRRTSIPPRPRISLNLWGVLKNCIGKELSRIPLPVNFNEPLSFLQRVTEDLTYSKCLDEAAQIPEANTVERMAWIAAFSVSCYATTAVRMSKPFNPLLGETYECDRSGDYGWRSFAEQVGHHPPVVAHYCESTRHGWKFWQEFTVNSKFRGKYLSLVPKGTTHLVFQDGQHYTWSKITITVHNIIVGRLWAENHGETVITSHTTDHICRMRYEAHSYFSRDTDRKVTGCIYDPSGTLVYKVSGTWDTQIDGYAVSPEGNPVSPARPLWIVDPPLPNSESMYNFNKFAMELNELEEGVAPTDSRLRPDQRLMELGRWDEANTEKERLEVKQRRKRYAWELLEEGVASTDLEAGPPYTPVWFSLIHDSYADEDCHQFNGKYWSAKATQDWADCPDIF